MSGTFFAPRNFDKRLRALSRRQFLSVMGRSGLVLPFSSVLPGFTFPQKPGTASKAQAANTSAVAGFSFKDITKEAGLAAAVNIGGGVQRKQYILEENGCGVALFDYDNDGWLDIFMVNGTRLEGISESHPPTNYLFHNNHDVSFSDVTTKSGLTLS
jgi:hypothetical protein